MFLVTRLFCNPLLRKVAQSFKKMPEAIVFKVGQNGFYCACVSVVFTFIPLMFYSPYSRWDMEELACFRPGFLYELSPHSKQRDPDVETTVFLRVLSTVGLEVIHPTTLTAPKRNEPNMFLTTSSRSPLGRSGPQGHAWLRAAPRRQHRREEWGGEGRDGCGRKAAALHSSYCAAVAQFGIEARVGHTRKMNISQIPPKLTVFLR